MKRTRSGQPEFLSRRNCARATKDLPPVPIAERDTDSGSGDAHGGRDGDTVLRRENDGDRSTELHGEAARGGDQGDSVTQDGHDVVTVSGQTEDQGGSSVDEHPDLDVRVLAGGETKLPSVVDDREGTDGVGQVVGSVGERGGATGEDLHKGVGVLGLVVVLRGSAVDGGHLGSFLFVTLLGLKSVNVDHRTVAEHLPGEGQDGVSKDDPDVSRGQGESFDLRLLDLLLERRLSGQSLGLVRLLQELGSLGLGGVLDGRVVRGRVGSRDGLGLFNVVVLEILSDSVVLDGGSRTGIGRGGTLPEKRSHEEVVPSESYASATIKVRSRFISRREDRQDSL